MCALSPSKLASSVDVSPAMPTTCALRNRALSCKVSDEFTVPLCRGHHRELHRHGDEAGWWNKVGVNPTSAARVLWLETHPQIVHAHS